MTGLVVLLVYLAGAVVTARRVAVAVMNHEERQWGECDGDDRLLAGVLGLASGAFWPVIVIAALILWRLPKTDGQLHAELAEQRGLVAQRDRRIAELERWHAEWLGEQGSAR